MLLHQSLSHLLQLAQVPPSLVALFVHLLQLLFPGQWFKQSFVQCYGRLLPQFPPLLLLLLLLVRKLLLLLQLSLSLLLLLLLLPLPFTLVGRSL